MIVGLHHASITTADLDRLSAFYCNNFGFECVLETQWSAGNAAADAIFGLTDTAVRMAMLRHTNCFLELFQFAAPVGDGRTGRRPVCDQGITHVCVAVENIDAEYARLTDSGMHFNCPPRDVPGLCRATYGHDPDGNIVEVMEIDPTGPFAFRALPGADAADIARRVEAFVRNVVAPYEHDPRCGAHGPSDDLVRELRDFARTAGVLTPHILPDGAHLTQRQTATVLKASGLSPLGPIAVNTMAPDEGNMYLLGKVASAEQKARFLDPLVAGVARSAFFMTEPAAEGGAGSDPSMMQTTAVLDGNHWVINGRKAFITGAQGARVGIIMAKSADGACMFLADLPDPAIRIERVLETIDSSMPGGHSVVTIDNLRLPADQMLGQSGEGFKYAQLRLAPARLSHCMRWHGACVRAHEIASAYACKRHAFGKPLIDHEGVGFMLAENMIDLKQSELMIDWCADVLDSGAPGTVESSMTKVAVSEALMRIADRCVQVMGGTGVSGDTIVEQVFREIRAFRIYDGPTEVHKWSLAKKIKRDAAERAA